jgi:DnaJ-class molecular chaperone
MAPRPKREGICDACHGVGKEACSGCGGTGQRGLYKTKRYGKPDEFHSRKCDLCGGKGHRGVNCSLCRGTGKRTH